MAFPISFKFCFQAKVPMRKKAGTGNIRLGSEWLLIQSHQAQNVRNELDKHRDGPALSTVLLSRQARLVKLCPLSILIHRD